MRILVHVGQLATTERAPHFSTWDTVLTSSEPRRLALWVVAVFLVAAATIGAWRWFVGSGSPTQEVVAVGPTAPSEPPSAALSASQVERAASSASAAVAKNPGDEVAWAMLANLELMRGNINEAVAAYRKLILLRPKDAQVLAEAADAIAATQGGRIAGEPAQLVESALKLDASNLKARAMAGKAAFEAKRYGEAAQHWEQALAAAPDSKARQQLETSLAETRALQGSMPAKPARNASGNLLAFVAGRVTVVEALKARIRPDDTVYVVARPTEGSRMPVALLKRRGSDLPLDFALDDTLAMVPTARLSQHREVIVRVLVSRRGDAIPSTGDFQGQTGPIAVGSGNVNVEIRDVVP